MIDNKYGIAYSEVLEILKHIPIEDYNKIPKNEIKLFEAYADNDYIFNYDKNKTLEEQNVSNITKGIIILLFRDYWATETQREKIIAKQKYDRQKIYEEKKKNYNPENIFKKVNLENIAKKETNLVEYKESNFQKFLNKIKNIFHIK